MKRLFSILFIRAIAKFDLIGIFADCCVLNRGDIFIQNKAIEDIILYKVSQANYFNIKFDNKINVF